MQEMRRPRSKIRWIIYGISTLGNISGRLSVSRNPCIRSDADAMREDFALVGRDIRRAMRALSGSNAPKPLKSALK